MNNMLPRICRSCGVTFTGGPRAWYCPECRAERARESKRTHKAAVRMGTARKIGGVYRCEDCGTEYVLKCGNSTRCPECAAKRIKELDNQQSKKWNASNPVKYAQAKADFRARRNSDSGRPSPGRYISWDKEPRKWRVRVKGQHVGLFADEGDAVKARDEFMRKVGDRRTGS